MKNVFHGCYRTGVSLATLALAGVIEFAGGEPFKQCPSCVAWRLAQLDTPGPRRCVSPFMVRVIKFSCGPINFLW